MVFSSQIFLFYFLPLALLFYYALPQRMRNAYFTLISYGFYAWANPWFVLLMLGSTALDWFCGIVLDRPGASHKSRKQAVTLSVVANLALLGFFKYFMFAQENLNRLAQQCGWEALPTLEILLPVGISFYTFQSMSYTIDLYRRQAKRAASFIDFACYVSMFPQLVAGPIVRYSEVANQLAERPQRGELFRGGAIYFMVGMAKKVLIANTLGEVAELVLDTGPTPAHVAWFGTAAHAFQYYFDFSGYSDMAIGLGMMFGFTLPVNFRAPYRALGMTEFWGRWHMSLSGWLRDYLYVPLGGNRRGKILTYRNLLLTMVLGGLWHGAEWTFLVWGACHGLMLLFERMIAKDSLYSRLPGPLCQLRTFLTFAILHLLFPAQSLAAAWSMFTSLFIGVDAAGGNAAAGAVLAGRVYQPLYLFTMALAVWITWWAPMEYVQRVRRNPALTAMTFVLFLLSVVAMFSQAANPFLYFRF